MRNDFRHFRSWARPIVLLITVLLGLPPVYALPANLTGLAPQSLGDTSQTQVRHRQIHSVAAVGTVSDGYPPLIIGPGDLLAINVYGETQLAEEYQVDADGLISFPYVGTIKVSGMTPIKASEKLALKLGKAKKVSILIEESNTAWVSVLGNVPRPGKYQIRGKPTLLSALAEAGGVLPGSDLGSSFILHDKTKKRINLDDFLQNGSKIRSDPFLFPGDALIVPKSGFPSTPGDFAVLVGIFASLTVAAYYLHQAKIINY